MPTSAVERYWKLAAILLVATGALCALARIPGRSLEYDEIWTWLYFVPQNVHTIFTDLATPNNHPLHTLLVKAGALLLPPTLALRITPWVSGLLLAILLSGTVRYWTRRWDAAALTAGWCACQPWLCSYASTGRGYALQSFLTLLLLLLPVFAKNEKGAPWRWGVTAFLLTLGICGSVTSGAIFAAALWAVTAVNFRRTKQENTVRRRELAILIGSTAGLAAGALWLLLHLSQLREAQNFGTPITTLPQWLRFCWNTLYQLDLLLPLLMVVGGVCWRRNPWRQELQTILFFTLLVLLSALVTRGGEPRSYLPLIAPLLLGAGFTAAAAGTVFSSSKWVPCMMVLLLLLPLSYFPKRLQQITPPDWGPFAQVISRATPSDTAILYHAGDTFPIAVNLPEAAADAEQRLVAPRQLVLVEFQKTAAPLLSVVDGAGGEKKLHFPETRQIIPITAGGKTVFLYRYRLTAISAAPALPDGLYLAIASSFGDLRQLPGGPWTEWSLANPWFPGNRRVFLGSTALPPTSAKVRFFRIDPEP